MVSVQLLPLVRPRENSQGLVSTCSLMSRMSPPLDLALVSSSFKEPYLNETRLQDLHCSSFPCRRVHTTAHEPDNYLANQRTSHSEVRANSLVVGQTCSWSERWECLNNASEHGAGEGERQVCT